MDLTAYMRIPELDHIAKENGIVVPRLRGYELMSSEEKVSPEEIDNVIKCAYLDAYEWACTSIPAFNPQSSAHEFSWRTDRIKDKYLVKNEDGEVTGFRWDLLHGKRRKVMKLALKHTKKSIEDYYKVFNKYVGRADVLRVHSRIGGGNWPYYYKEVMGKPWFLEKIDDFYDNTYCDIYCKINSIGLGE